MPDAQEFSTGRASNSVRVLARMLSLAENQPQSAYAVLAESGIDPGNSHVVGITGPPGVGKSSLVSALISEFRMRGESVAVLAVDPSSPFSGGALLGDRIRMNAHAADRGVYIRSMATRGVLGGLSRAAWAGVRILSTWGFDWVLIETAGVGQSEIDVVSLADTTLLVLSPGLGDDVQVMKAGIMEIADIFVINKADLPGADRVRNSLRSILRAAPPTPDDSNHDSPTHDTLTSDEVASDAQSAADRHGHGSAGMPGNDVGAPQVYSTMANAVRGSSGVPALAEGLITRTQGLSGTGRMHDLQARRTRVEIRRAALALLEDMVDTALENRAVDPNTDPLIEARDIVQQIVDGTEKAGIAEPVDGEEWC